NITNLRHKLDGYSDGGMITFMEQITRFVQNLVHYNLEKLKKTRNSEKIPPFIRKIENELTRYKLPKSLIQHFIERNETDWKADLISFIQKNGENKTLDLMIGPDGALNMLKNHDSTFSSEQKQLIEKQLKIIWTMYMSSMSPLALQIYPHEDFGRYPIVKPDLDTRKIYEERKTELKSMIDQCESIYARIRKMLESENH
ncbi:MAG: hypothetical protein QXE82_04710, partial [Candidatus Nitrosotenuis sp.]